MKLVSFQSKLASFLLTIYSYFKQTAVKWHLYNDVKGLGYIDFLRVSRCRSAGRWSGSGEAGDNTDGVVPSWYNNR